MTRIPVPADQTFKLGYEEEIMLLIGGMGGLLFSPQPYLWQFKTSSRYLVFSTFVDINIQNIWRFSLLEAPTNALYQICGQMSAKIFIADDIGYWFQGSSQNKLPIGASSKC